MKSAKTILYVLLMLFPLCGHPMEMKHSPTDTQEGGGASAISSSQPDLGHQIPASVPDEEHEPDQGIYSPEQLHYLELIKRIAPDVYKALIKCGNLCKKSCLKFDDKESAVLFDDDEAAILNPSDESNGYPTIVFKRGREPNEEFLRTKILPAYKEMLTSFYFDHSNDRRIFFYVALAEEVNLAISEALLPCIPQCFRKAAHDYQGPFVIPAKPYPLIIIPWQKPWFLLTADNLRSPFEKWYELYKTSNFLPQEEREHFLKIIHDLAPELYEEFKFLGDEVFKYFKRHEDPAVCDISSSPKTGLPKITYGSELRNYPIKWQKFILAHELGHYSLQHLKKEPPNFPFDTIFKMARRRINEYEADRYAVMNLGADPAAGIEWLEYVAELFGTTKYDSKKTFYKTHPQYLDRIKHLQALQVEVELQKARGSKPQPPDWKALIQYYKEE